MTRNRRRSSAVALMFMSLGFVACGPSRPPRNARPADLRNEVSQHGGDRYGRCVNNDADSCHWVVAFWTADRDAAEADCRAGRAGRCVDAATWFRGTEVLAGGLPAWVEHLPPDPAKRAAALARACELASTTNQPPERGITGFAAGDSSYPNSSFMAQYCVLAGTVFADGVGMAPDFARAEAYLRRACDQRRSTPCGAEAKDYVGRRRTLEGTRNECEPVGATCDLTDGPTSLLQQRLHETPEQRAQRVAAVEEKRQGRIDKNNDLRDRMNAEDRAYAAAHSGDAANAVAAGFSAGMQTVNATNQSLANAQANINQMTARPTSPPGAPPPPAPTNAAAATQTTVLPNQPVTKPVLTAADRKHNLEACLATDKNCEYGTSTACQPSVPYGDAFGHRHVLTRAAAWASQCSKPWPQCKQDALMLAGSQADLQALAARVDDVVKRKIALPPNASVSCPATTANSEDVRKVHFWCDNAQKDCAPALTAAAAALENARAIEQCLHSVEFQVRRNSQKAQHDAECHRTWD